MARYVVVEFADNADAEAFISEVDEMNKIRRDDRMPFVRRIAAVFVKPGSICQCWDWNVANYRNPDQMKHQGRGIAEGEKFGWWVCSTCKKPRRAGHKLRNQVDISTLYEGDVRDSYEFCITGIDITGIHTNQIDRPKKLRPKKAKD